MTAAAIANGLTAFDWVARSAFAYPLLEVAHIVGIALLVGPLVLLEVSLWRNGGADARALARLALPAALAGFALVVASGLTMFASQPGELLANPAFALKMLLVAAAGANAGLFHLRAGLERRDRFARMQTVLSLGLWLAVIICGRWIAYV